MKSRAGADWHRAEADPAGRMLKWRMDSASEKPSTSTRDLMITDSVIFYECRSLTMEMRVQLKLLTIARSQQSATR